MKRQHTASLRTADTKAGRNRTAPIGPSGMRGWKAKVGRCHTVIAPAKQIAFGWAAREDRSLAPEPQRVAVDNLFARNGRYWSALRAKQVGKPDTEFGHPLHDRFIAADRRSNRIFFV